MHCVVCVCGDVVWLCEFRDVYNVVCAQCVSCHSFAVHRVMLLEFSQYLENYLWPNYGADASDAHLLSIVVMVNEKFRERVPAWEVCCFTLTKCVYFRILFLSAFFANQFLHRL